MLIDINLYQLASTTKPTGWMEFQPVGFALPYSCSFCSGSAADRICGIVKGLCHAAGISGVIRSCTTLRTAVPRRKFVFRDGERHTEKSSIYQQPPLPICEKFLIDCASCGGWFYGLRYEYLLLKNITAAIDNRSPANI